MNRSLLFVTAGALSGALILGIAGRAATASLAHLYSFPLNLSLKGVIEAVILGTVVGGLGGLLLNVLQRVWSRHPIWGGMTVGVILFGCTTLFFLILGRFVFDLSLLQSSTLAVAFFLFLVYGITAAALSVRLITPRRN
ncbi:hypothetical protein JW992_14205 [candidate division KSB1 bacterium]|nr:hypothetical protein [candidate division KSB1 bacterium]